MRGTEPGANLNIIISGFIDEKIMKPPGAPSIAPAEGFSATVKSPLSLAFNRLCFSGEHCTEMHVSPFVRLLGIVGILSLAGCRDRSEVRIGFIGGMSGSTADLGVDARRGVLLAVEEQNATGGLRGRTVVLHSKDVDQEDASARKAFLDLEAEGVAGIIGPLTSEMCVAVLPEVERGNTLVISPTASTPELGGKDDNFLRTYTPGDLQAWQVASFIDRQTDVRRLAILFDGRNRAHGVPYAAALKSGLEALGGEVSATIEFGQSGAFDYAATVQEALETKPDGLFILANSLDSAQFCQQLRKFGSTIPAFGSEWSSSSLITSYGGDSVEGFTFVQTVDLGDTDPRYQSFVDRFEARFGLPPGFAAILAFEATQILFEGIEEGGIEGARDWILERQNFTTLQGSLRIDEFGDCYRSAYMVQVRNRKFHRLKLLE